MKGYYSLKVHKSKYFTIIYSLENFKRNEGNVRLQCDVII